MAETSLSGSSLAPVNLRPFAEKDFDLFASLLADLWHPGSDRNISLLQGSEELSHHLSEASWGIVAEQSDSQGQVLPLGLCLVRLTSDFVLPEEAQGDAGLGGAIDAAAWDARHDAFVARAQTIGAFGPCPDPICAAEDVLMDHTIEIDGTSVGILQLLVISPDARGLGLGRRLMQAGLSLIKAAGATRYRLSTDEGCDWQFYEHIGLRRIAEDTLALPAEAEQDDNDRSFTARSFTYFVYEGAL